MSDIGPVAGPWEPYDRLILRTPDLVAYWPGAELTGIVGADVKGGRNATYVAAPTLGAVGPIKGETFNPAVLYNGSTQWTTIVNNAALIPYPLTIEAWITPPSGGAQSIFGGAYDGGNMAYLLELGSAGQLIGYLFGSPSLHYTGAGTDLRDSLWHHVALVGSPTANDLIVDGASSHHTAGTWTAMAKSAAGLVIGARNAASQPFNGRIARVALYGRNLSLAELASHNAAGRA